ncbi:MAG: YihY/virulence factor BrkB family protein [Oscillospiraceae bacterium]|nr:YihY/virulence factor BrkB family protein [Oscillospiraceae bacterium]MBR3961958.1 YihY/virulence factor BrkB family protein [Oscillospiraceae bacterium]
MNHIFSIKGIIGIAEKFFALRMNRSAAALSYYLIMTLFPMLICVQWILSAVGEDIVLFLEGFSELIPPGVLSIIEDYLAYSGSQSSGLLIIGISTAIITGASAFRILSDTLREIFESRGGNDALRFAFSFIYAVAFLVAVYVLGITVIGGRWLINILEPFFELIDFINLLDLANLWNWFRFVILNIISTGMLYTVYYCNAWRSPYRINVLPGAVFGSLVFTVVSGFFSWFISSSVKYSAVYGSLASVIILMLWLYILSNIILLGALLNKELSEHKNDQQKFHSAVHSFINKKP